MVRDINALDQESIQHLLTQIDAVCFGMGLGRDEWAEQIYLEWFNLLNQNSHLEVVLDADGLWFLAKHPQQLNTHVYATPHSGEAATLLGCTAGILSKIVLQRFISYNKNMQDNGCLKVQVAWS
jgi:NAD(P)H-hydrate repair Nnr-like enzyme with NAD(P)H-hydrate dehydratase domain